MSKPSLATDYELVIGMQADDETAFRTLFDRYYKYMVVTAGNVLGDWDVARDLTQDVFLQIWKNRKKLKIEVNASLKSYLRRAVINKTLNYIKAKRLDYFEPENLPQSPSKEASAQQQLEASDLEKIVHDTINSLPEKCRLIFTLCRLEHLSHKEIAQKLSISTKTVENQMTKALKILRQAVQPHIGKNK